MAPRIAVIAYHFYPSQEVGAKRMNALAASLRDRGTDLVIYSAFEGLNEWSERAPSQLRGYDLREVPNRTSRLLGLLVRAKKILQKARPQLTDSAGAEGIVKPSALGLHDKPSWLHRLFFNVLYVIDNKKGWSRRCARLLVATSKSKLPAIIIVSGPPMSSLIAAVVAGRRLRIPVILDLRDPIYGEDRQTLAGHGVPIQWGRRMLERLIVPSAASVTTTSPTLQERLRTRYPTMRHRVTCIYNGYDGELCPKKERTDNRLVMVYAGSLYMNRNPFPFLEILEDVLLRPDVNIERINVIFAGDCQQYGGVSLTAWLANRRCANVVQLHTRLNSEELGRLYHRATLLLNFAEGQPMQIPAKTFELLSLGREILAFCEPTSDTASVLRNLEGVACVSSDDREGLRSAILDIYHRHVVQGVLNAPSPEAVSSYSRAAQNRRFLEVVNATTTGDWAQEAQARKRY
jgi:hypothetical protein